MSTPAFKDLGWKGCPTCRGCIYLQGGEGKQSNHMSKPICAYMLETGKSRPSKAADVWEGSCSAKVKGKKGRRIYLPEGC